MKEDFKEIESLIEKYHSIILSKKRLAKVEQELKYQKELLVKLDRKVDREYLDVVALENHPLRQLFGTILRGKIEQLKIEREEYLQAFLEFKECKKLIELLTYEKEVLSSKDVDGELILSSLRHKMDEVESSPLFKNSMYLKTIKELNEELLQMSNVKMELADVLYYVLELKTSFNAMIAYLNRAQETKNWTATYQEIQERKLIKLSHMDSAHVHLKGIKRTLVYLEEEIYDLIPFENYFRTTHSLIRGFNVQYYAELISDWVEDKNLMDTLTMTLSSSAAISKMEMQLENLKKQVDREYLAQKEKRDVLIEKITLKKYNP